MKFINKNELKINQTLFNFINEEVLPGTNIKQDDFWDRFAKVVHELAPINKKLIEKREKIQKQIDDWHLSNSKEKFDKNKYTQFLKSISYIVDEGDNFKIETSNVDEEIAKIAGPQLVVPVDNARYALNAVNARWGSLYNSLYGTDAIPGKKGTAYNKERGYLVIDHVKEFFDKVISYSLLTVLLNISECLLEELIFSSSDSIDKVKVIFLSYRISIKVINLNCWFELYSSKLGISSINI